MKRFESSCTSNEKPPKMMDLNENTVLTEKLDEVTGNPNPVRSSLKLNLSSSTPGLGSSATNRHVSPSNDFKSDGLSLGRSEQFTRSASPRLSEINALINGLSPKLNDVPKHITNGNENFNGGMKALLKISLTEGISLPDHS